jgi:hypothetical protein
MTTPTASTASGNAPQQPYPAASSTARQITEQRRGAVLRSLARTYQGRPPAQVHRVLRDALRPLGLRLPAAALHKLAQDIAAGQPVELP